MLINWKSFALVDCEFDVDDATAIGGHALLVFRLVLLYPVNDTDIANDEHVWAYACEEDSS